MAQNLDDVYVTGSPMHRERMLARLSDTGALVFSFTKGELADLLNGLSGNDDHETYEHARRALKKLSADLQVPPGL